MKTNNQIEIKKFITPDIKKQMSYWEQNFITSLYNRKQDWTDKQVETFENIKKKYQLQERKVVENVIYLPTGYAKGAKINQEITSRTFRKKRAIKRNKNSSK